jgi:protein-S-isoprenylcysteine O-methyltransferase Ste14
MMLDLALVQVRVEEAHLKGQHGEDYTRYCRAVRRWI